MDKQDFSYKVVKNTVFNIIGYSWMIIVTLFLTPYIIRHVGIERYGIWVIIGLVTGYFGLLDFGIGQSFVKFISESYTKGDYKGINGIVNTGLWFYSIFGILCIVGGFFFIEPILSFFKIPPYLHNEASFIFLLGIAIFCVSGAISPFIEIQKGLQRMDITNKVTIGMSVPLMVGTVFFLQKGYGLRGLMVNNGLLLIIGSAVNIIVAFRLIPGLKIDPFLKNNRTFKVLFMYGYKVQVSKLASMLHFQLDRLIIAHFLNVGLVTYYSVAAQIAHKMRSIPVVLISAIFPAAAELDAKQDNDSLSQLYYRSLKYLVVMSMPLSIAVIFMARPFINLWLGAGYEKSVITLQILSFAYFINILTGPGYFILNGMGKPEYSMKASLLGGFLNLILSIFLAIKMGYFGVVIATACALSIGAFYFTIFAVKVLNIQFWSMYSKIFVKPLLASAISFLIIFFAANKLLHFGWHGLICYAFLYFALFALIILKIGYLDQFDKSLIRRYNPLTLFRIKETKPQ